MLARSVIENNYPNQNGCLCSIYQLVTFLAAPWDLTYLEFWVESLITVENSDGGGLVDADGEGQFTPF